MSDISLIIQYTGFSGEEAILRTICEDNGDILVSLEDIVRILAIENNKLSKQHGRHGLGQLVTATAEVLDDDERKYISTPDGKRMELFVTQPGMYRVVSRDNSPACKKFQRWLFHDVLPSIQKYGTYPPPIVTQDSELKLLAKALIQNSELILKEIEEREKLESMIIAKFGITDQRLKIINERLDKFEYTQPEIFVDVAAVCKDHNENIDTEYVFAWCYKICLEKNIPIRKNFDSPNGRLFPRTVVYEAIALAKESKST